MRILICAVFGILLIGCYRSAGSKENEMDAGGFDGDLRSAPDTDTDTDSDTDSDTDTDADSGSIPSKCMNDFGRQCIAAGDWCDPISGLCWVNTEDRLGGGWYTQSYEDCRALDSDSDGGVGPWDIPTIDELISLMRGCQNGVATGDMSPSTCVMIPENCSENDRCTSSISCECCEPGKGPGLNGCYWDPDLVGTCRFDYGGELWWSSAINSGPHDPWQGSFYGGCLSIYVPASTNRIYIGGNPGGASRCVRRNPNEN